MKQFIFLIGLLSFCVGAHAQTDSIYVWNKWCARKDTLLLFTTANNVIEIYCHSIKPGDIKLKSLDNSLRIGRPEIKGDTLTILAMPYPEKEKNNNMRLAIMYKKSGKMIKTVNFNSADVPPLMARIGKIERGEAARKDILSQTAMYAVFPNSLYSYPYRIKQYTFKITTPKGGATINGTGIFINRDVMQEIKDAPENTVVEFTNIKATCPECAVRSLDDIKLKIK